MTGSDYQPLLIKDLRIEAGGSRIERLALNRHMPKVEKVSRHRHNYDQLLLYFRGSGVQLVEDRALPVRRGTLIFLEKECFHGFRKERNISPLCMAIDLRLKVTVDWAASANVPGDHLQKVEQGLYRIGKLQSSGDVFSIPSEMLNIVSILEQQLRCGRPLVKGRLEKLVLESIKSCDLKDVSSTSVANRLGKSIDYVNRQLKRENDTSIGKLISGFRFDTATRLLLDSGKTISDVAMEVGIDDQNYFSRWFRKQSGVSPTQWRQSR